MSLCCLVVFPLFQLVAVLWAIKSARRGNVSEKLFPVFRIGAQEQGGLVRQSWITYAEIFNPEGKSREREPEKRYIGRYE